MGEPLSNVMMINILPQSQIFHYWDNPLHSNSGNEVYIHNHSMYLSILPSLYRIRCTLPCTKSRPNIVHRVLFHIHHTHRRHNQGSALCRYRQNLDHCNNYHSEQELRRLRDNRFDTLCNQGILHNPLLCTFHMF